MNASATRAAGAATKPMRQAMPKVAAFIDACRDAFGAAAVDQAIRAALDGQPTFYAAENGRQIGTACPPPGARFTVDQLLLAGFPSIPAAKQ